jgi:arylsulfatase A-like enzyme
MNVIVILCDTLRRDHCGPYNLGRPLNECWSRQAPPWVVPTPNMDRLAARGTVFDNCYCGSTPCMPARRDIYTGRYEFLERGWGPLEDDDLDLPRQVSGPPNMSIRWSLQQGYRVSYLVTDHFHLWEQGSGNYHMGYTGFEFIRGFEADAWRTDPVEFPCPKHDRLGKNERHWRNVHLDRKGEEDWFCARTFRAAADWLERNCSHENFYLHIDSFTPHEPFDAPDEYIRMFAPKGSSVEIPAAAAPYAPWRDKLTEEQFVNYRARYAARVVFLDKWLGRLLDAMDRLDLWKNTMVILTTDHGTFNGDHERMGKLQTHEHDAKGHIPFIIAHPGGRGGRRNQIVQLVDVYPTVLDAVGRPLPQMPEAKLLHGVSLLPVLQNADARSRDYAVVGQFGTSVGITDGRWILHQSPVEGNRPLYWHGCCLAKFLRYDLGPYIDARREVRNCRSWPTETWLSDKQSDPNELVNLAGSRGDKLREMQLALRDTLIRLKAPPEQFRRLGLNDAR